MLRWSDSGKDGAGGVRRQARRAAGEGAVRRQALLGPIALKPDLEIITRGG